MKRFYLQSILILICLSLLKIQAQDLGDVIKSKPFKFAGNLYLSGNGYSNFSNTPLRSSPYSYSIIGSPVFTIYGISIPFTFAFSDQQFSYSQPFNIYGVSPSYKWAKIHLGYRAMNFSSYTVSGKQFYGAGIELTPGKFRFNALYGSLKDLYAQQDTLTFGSHILDTYERKINGIKIGYGEKNSIDFMYVKVSDIDNGETQIQEADNKYLLPEDNLVIGLNANISLFKRLRFFIETAASLHTSNIRANIDFEDETINDLANKIEKLIRINASTRWGFAGKTGFRLSFQNFNFGLNYQRVDPFFKSLGLYYMNTDFENYTANSGINLFHNSLRIGITAGIQQNNISKLKQQTDLRKIGSVNISYFSQKGFSFIANYSNYKFDQTAGYIKIEDTLRLALVNEMAIISPSYNWEKGKYNHSININFSYQKFNDVNNQRIIKLIDDINYNTSINYSFSYQPSNLSLNAGANYFLLTSREREESQFGFDLGINKKFLKKKLNLRLSGSWNKNFYNNISDGHTINIRHNISYLITQKQNVALNFYWMNRTGIHQRNFNELRSSISYGLSF